MVKAKELKEWADKVVPILIDAKIALANLRIIKVESENKLHIINQGFFQNLWFQQRFILMIQLAKIFTNSRNQKKNFIKLCDRLENEGLDVEIEAMLNENKSKLTDVFRSRDDLLVAIKKFRSELEENKNPILNIITLRDKVFAHSDNIESKPKVLHNELEGITELACEMYNTLFGKIFDRHFHFRTEDLDLRYVIEKLKTK